jgi:hypothetical protein
MADPYVELREPILKCSNVSLRRSKSGRVSGDNGKCWQRWVF